MRGRPAKYLHLFKALQVGDSIYLPAPRQRFDRQCVSMGLYYGIKVKAANFVAVNNDPATAHRVVRITRVE